MGLSLGLSVGILVGIDVGCGVGSAKIKVQLQHKHTQTLIPNLKQTTSYNPQS